MVRKALISIVSGLALVVAPAPVALAADSTPKVEHRTIRASLDQKSVDTLGKLQLRNVKTGETIRAFDPPGGGCSYPLGFNGIASYTDGVLTSVTLDYWAQAVCTATGPNQNMAALVVTAQMWKDTTFLGEGPTVNCIDCLVSPVSQDFYACGGVGCAGGYWSANVHALKAPAGYIWPTAPPGCIGLGTAPYEWIQCSTVSDIVPVSPNY